MSLREEQCNKVCRILDDVLANRPTERDSLIVAVRKAFDAMQTAEPKRGKWIDKDDTERFIAQCNCCRYIEDSRRIKNFCPNCGADMR